MRIIESFKQKDSICIINILLRLIIILCIGKPVHCQLVGEDPNISISLSCFREQVGTSELNQMLPKLIPISDANILDPIILKLTITNKSTKEISVLYPHLVYRTAILSFRDKATGEQVPDQVRWSLGAMDIGYVNIQKGKSYEALLYLEQIYPNGFSPGTYEINIQYNPDHKTVLQTNSISLKIAPQSEDEKQHAANFIKFVREGGGINDIELFLKENPVGRFRNRIYFRFATEQIQLKEYEVAGNIFDDIISDKNSTTFQKSEALYQKARMLKDHLGKLDEAIQCLEKSPLRSAKLTAEQWKNQKDIKGN